MASLPISQVEFVVTFVPFVMKIICVNLRNLWFPFCLSVFVSWCLCGYESIMQNKANLLDTQMNTTFLLTKRYENERLCRRDEKQTQTKPICAATK
jgi:cobalamin biosynthesis protein CobD/CbiB